MEEEGTKTKKKTKTKTKEGGEGSEGRTTTTTTTLTRRRRKKRFRRRRKRRRSKHCCYSLRNNAQRSYVCCRCRWSSTWRKGRAGRKPEEDRAEDLRA